MLAVAGAPAAPWYRAAALDIVTATDVAAAPASQRVVVVWGQVKPASAPGPALPALRQTVAPLLNLPHASTVLGEQGLVTIGSGRREAPGQVA